MTSTNGESAGGQGLAKAAMSGSGLRKSFDQVEVLHGVDLHLQPGKVHALLGENGAGKSTIINLLSGRLQPDAGEITLSGKPISFRNPLAARRAGVSVIAQELELVPTMSVVENVFLGVEPTGFGVIRWRDAKRKVRSVLKELGVDIDPDRIVSTMGVADQQLVEIAKAIIGDFRVLIMDEPTSALNLEDTKRLFKIVRRLKADGVAILYVSHRLWEVFDIADQVTVVRDGSRIFTVEIAQTDVGSVIRGMLGAKSSLLEGARGHRAPPMGQSQARSIFGLANIVSGDVLKGVSVSVRAGEVVGFAGVMGSGRAELCEAIYGLRNIDAGEIRVDEAQIKFDGPKDALTRGIFLLPEDRKLDGIFSALDVRENVILDLKVDKRDERPGRASANGLRRLLETIGLRPIKSVEERRAFSTMHEKLGIRCSGPAAPITSLSGGNQQKVLFARGALARPLVLVLSEPTRGVDVGAKEEIYSAIDAFAAAGIAIVVSSSEIGELLRLCHRIQVFREGRIVADVSASATTEQQVLEQMAG